MSKHRRSDADAAVAQLFQRNPELGPINPHLAQPARQPHAAYRPTEAKAPAPTEHEEQCALFEWAAANEGAHPELVMLHATPNGGYRPMTTAVMLKAEGVRAGYPDISLDVPRGRWHGLRIELKRADRSNHATPEQIVWMDRLSSYGYMAVVAYGADEAIKVIEHYLSLDERNAA